MCRQTFAIVMMLLLFSNVSSAQTADSIVTVSSVDFSGDTISARYEIVTHYWKGKEVFKQDIQFKSETEWSDSTTTISVYSRDGQLIRSTRNDISSSWCHRYELPPFNEREVYFSTYLFPETSKLVYYLCKVYFTETKEYTDSTEIGYSVYNDQDTEMMYYDTIRYFSNHLIRSNVHYQNKEKQAVKTYSYEYDSLDRPIVIIEHVEDRGSLRVYENHQIFKDQTPYATLSSYKFYPDTLNSSEFERYYDDQFRQIKYVQRIAGVFEGYGISTYDSKGRGLMSKTFNRDSTLRDHHEAHWIEKKNSLECWYYQNYFSSDENDGIGYSLLDTTYNGQFTIIKSYGVRHNKRVDQWKRPRKKDLILGYTVVKDKYGRDVEITHFDTNGKVSFALTYTYSK
jgi:hypothetical protein